MNKVLKFLGTDKEYRIAVIQYERAGYGVGTEEQLHWAIVVLTKDALDREGPCFQAIDRHYNDNRGIVWSLYDQNVSLGKTKKCLGGMYIGSIKSSQLQALREVISANPPLSKFSEWNCRDWVMEVIQLLRENRWVHSTIPDQAALLPALRFATKATKAAYQKSERSSPVIVELIHSRPFLVG